MHQASDVEIKNTDLLYDGIFKIRSLHLRHRTYSGEWTPWIEREQISRQDAVAVLLYDPKVDAVVMVEQLRIGALRSDNTQSPWLLEIVAGLCDHDEPFIDTAYREAKEEAECEITQLFRIGEFYPTPGGFTEKTQLYCGMVDSTATGKLCGNPHEHEDIQVRVIPTETVLKDWEAGRLMTSASTVIALLWLQHKRTLPDWQWHTSTAV